jgi:hypothetical protein
MQNDRRAYDTRILADGRVLDVVPLLFGRARLTISRDLEDEGNYDHW